MSEGPAPPRRYCSAREHALAETAIEWPTYEYKEVRANLGAHPECRAAQGYEVEVHPFLDPNCPRYFPLYPTRSHPYEAAAGVVAAGLGVGAARWIFLQPASAPLPTVALAVFGACAVFFGVLLRRWT